ncbi:hypothetical protein DFO77_12031 [Marinilabilia salmonicolor]|jgi:hypothetical protein|uniref:Uncharacterized protein n=1 Tax=Marinilabilia salmonicolor TaxID=989 RepID=A0A368UQ31_9BACT|nr:hypothetical protein DFO77_12031 [Marinilabilia salmonicolor]
MRICVNRTNPVHLIIVMNQIYFSFERRTITFFQRFNGINNLYGREKEADKRVGIV